MTDNVIQLSNALVASLAEDRDPVWLPEPEPGLYPQNAFDSYVHIPAVNFSTLKEMAQSPLRYRHRLQNPKKETRSMGLGSTSHVAVLEPDRFTAEYVMFPGKENKGTKAWKKFVADNPGKRVIKADEYYKAKGITKAVWRNPKTAQHLKNLQTEAVLIWRDKETGILCKCRLDGVDINNHKVIDLKSCASLDPFLFNRTASNLEYHMQVSMYSDGYEAVFGETPEFTIIAVEQEPPHDCAPYSIPEETFDAGRDDYMRLLTQLRHCRETNEWPGRGEMGPMEFRLPKWRLPDEGGLEGLELEA